MGEFGRTPKLGPKGGRDHYALAFSTVLFGGIKGGQVIGRTNKFGATVEECRVSPGDFFAIIFKVMGHCKGTRSRLAARGDSML